MLGRGLAPLASYTYPGTIYATQAADYSVVLQPKAAQTAGIPLTLRGVSGQTGALQAWQDYTSANLGVFSANGLLSLTPTPGGGAIGVTQSGTMTGISTVPALSITRSLANGGFNIISSAPLIFANDNSSGTGINQSDLLRLQTAGVDKFRLGINGINTVAYSTAGGLNTIANPPVAINNAQSATSGSLTNGATYLYAVTSVNAQGTEGTNGTILTVTIPAGGTGTSGQQTISWSSQPGAVSYNVYRSDPNGTTLTTLAGNSISSPFVDSLAGSVKTPPASTTVFPSIRFQGTASGSGSFLAYSGAYNASANYGVLSIVSAPIDGVSANKFAGFSQGTLLAMNTHTGNSPDFARYQVVGNDRYRLTQGGLETLTASDAVTAGTSILRTDQHLSSGTPTTNFGIKHLFQLHSSANILRDAVTISALWSNATDGSQTANLLLGMTLNGAATSNYYTFAAGGPLTIGSLAPNKALVINAPVAGTVNAAEFSVAGTMRTAANSRGDFIIGNAGTGMLGGEYQSPAAVTAGASSGTGGNLTNGAVYFWQVVFVDVFGNESIPGTEVTATIPAGAGSAGSQVITWTATVGPSSVRIYRTAANGASGTENVLAGTVAGNLGTFTDAAVGSAQSPANLTGVASVRQPTFFGFYNHVSSFSPLHVSEHQNLATTRPMVALGSGPFDGVSSGFFSAGSGTVIGINTNVARDFISIQQLGVQRYVLASSGLITSTFIDATTNTQPVIRTFNHRTSGTPAASFGSTLKFGLDSSNNTLRDAAALQPFWTTATDGAQVSSLNFQVTGTTANTLTNRFVLKGLGGANLPWVSGDTATTLLVGSATSGNNQNAVDAFSDSGTGLTGRSASGLPLLAIVNDAGTNTITNVAVFSHRSTGSVAAGLGTQLTLSAQSTTTADRPQAVLLSSWVVATDASRTARLAFSVLDSAGTREGLRIEASGTAPMIGFLGAAAVVRQTLAAAATDLASVITLANSLRTALINLGLGA